MAQPIRFSSPLDNCVQDNDLDHVVTGEAERYPCAVSPGWRRPQCNANPVSEAATRRARSAALLAQGTARRAGRSPWRRSPEVELRSSRVNVGASLYGRSLTSSERRDEGLALREAVPVDALADLNLPAARRPALELLRAQDVTRIPWLVPVRYGRMMADPFSFFRGAAAVMAADLSAGPRTTATVQLCGDAHLANFGLFSSPERRLVFDANDFDETLPGPFEWDVKRLATSCVLAAGEAGLSGKQRRSVAREATCAYHAAISAAAAMAPLDVWYFRLDYDELLGLQQLDERDQKLAEKAGERANLKTNLGAWDKLTEVVDGRRIIRTRRPIVVRLEPDQLLRVRQELDSMFEGYLSTLPPNRRSLLRRYGVADVALKVVGVGSVGTRCFVVLLQAGDGQPLFLQLKEAGPSVLEAELGPSQFEQAV